MDGSFACPECGSTIEVRGLTPGRQTRCEFCNRLVEIPFIPRIADPSWHRFRFRRSRRFVLGWTAVAVTVAALVVGGGARLMSHRSRAARLETITRLTQSATRQSATGADGPALIDLDAAIELAGSMDQIDSCLDLATLRRTRQETARRDAEKILGDLTRRDDFPQSAGAWLSLRARIGRDSDLAAIQRKAETAFQAQVNKSLESESRIATTSLESHKYESSLESCLRLDRMLKYLPPDVRERWRNRLESIVAALVQVAGVVVTESHGELLEGSRHPTYTPELMRTASKALRDQGYLPPPREVPWRSLWSHAPYRLNLEVVERREGNYHATQNRLARIEVHLTLSTRNFPIWSATSVARSRVPLVEVPSSISKRLAISRERINEFEDLLYTDAEALIGAHLAATVQNLPRCPGGPPGVPASG